MNEPHIVQLGILRLGPVRKELDAGQTVVAVDQNPGADSAYAIVKVPAGHCLERVDLEFV